ncbi:Aste57867_24214 [Aphanomyces stellatus]|uniref:Aste57867_24214 protein n=1 Tax=Aphanomyces stellatus TaxID=120398 RepID=A0A485LQK2_9STRA|nr:hypothetical protein As57867_024139 [Aphanomyces stellatus]VFU00855.1 Aste57867_24214 [Aphanomyces stellatus]
MRVAVFARRQGTIMPRPARRTFLTVPKFMESSSLRKEHKEKRVVPFSCQDMYDVVANVDGYVSFLPFCVSSRVIRRPSAGVMEADLTVGFQIFTETYRSRVLLDAPRRILITSIESPTFKSIERSVCRLFLRGLTTIVCSSSEWAFRELSPTSCEVNFRVAFEVSSILHSHALRLFFDDVAKVQLNAFIKQATKLQLSRPAKTTSEFALLDGATSPCGRAALESKVPPSALAHLEAIFATHAQVGRDGGASQLYLNGFGAACTDLLDTSEWAQTSTNLGDLRKISGEHNSALASAVFASYIVHDDKAGQTSDWLSFEEFAVRARMGLYMTLFGSPDEKAVYLFQIVDSTGDGVLSPDEVRRALERRIRVVKDIFPMLLQEQLEYHLGDDATTAEQARLNEECMKVGLMAIESLMAQVETDIPLAVNQVFLSTPLSTPNRISLDEWRGLWQGHPELVELMTIDGMKKIMQLVKPPRKPDEPHPGEPHPRQSQS